MVGFDFTQSGTQGFHMIELEKEGDESKQANQFSGLVSEAGHWKQKRGAWAQKNASNVKINAKLWGKYADTSKQAANNDHVLSTPGNVYAELVKDFEATQSSSSSSSSTSTTTLAASSSSILSAQPNANEDCLYDLYVCNSGDEQEDQDVDQFAPLIEIEPEEFVFEDPNQLESDYDSEDLDHKEYDYSDGSEFDGSGRDDNYLQEDCYNDRRRSSNSSEDDCYGGRRMEDDRFDKGVYSSSKAFHDEVGS